MRDKQRTVKIELLSQWKLSFAIILTYGTKYWPCYRLYWPMVQNIDPCYQLYWPMDPKIEICLAGERTQVIESIPWPLGLLCLSLTMFWKLVRAFRCTYLRFSNTTKKTKTLSSFSFNPQFISWIKWLASLFSITQSKLVLAAIVMKCEE